MGAMQLGMPYIHVSNALHLDFSGYTPLSLYDWPHQTTPSALARNREGVTKFAKILENANAGIKAYAESAGLKIDWESPDSTVSPLASITQTPRAFDFESAHWPSQLNDSTYRDNARKLQKAIAKTNGISIAADLVEESLGVTKS
jgi:zeaxanthin glucosyltransferase